MQQCLSKSLKFKGFAALCFSQGFDNPVGSQDEGDPRQQRGNLPSPPQKKLEKITWAHLRFKIHIQKPNKRQKLLHPVAGIKKQTKILAGKIPEIQQTVKVGRGICLLKVGLVQRTAPLGAQPRSKLGLQRALCASCSFLGQGMAPGKLPAQFLAGILWEAPRLPCQRCWCCLLSLHLR